VTDDRVHHGGGGIGESDRVRVKHGGERIKEVEVVTEVRVRKEKAGPVSVWDKVYYQA